MYFLSLYLVKKIVRIIFEFLRYVFKKSKALFDKTVLCLQCICVQSYCSHVDLSCLLRANDVIEPATSSASLTTPDTVLQPVMCTVPGTLTRSIDFTHSQTVMLIIMI